MKLAGVVLAAGRGSRLAPLTDTVPKALLPVAGRSLLVHQVRRLEMAGAERVYVNAHHRAAQVTGHLERHAPAVVHRVEPALSGPAGALALFADSLRSFDATLVISCDVLVGADLEGLQRACLEDEAALTFGAIATAGAGEYGVLEVDGEGFVTAATEKPDLPDDEVHLVSAGAYCVRPEAIEEAVRQRSGGRTVDFAADLAPALLAGGRRVTARRLSGYWRDVGTEESLRAAERDASAGRIPWIRA